MRLNWPRLIGGKNVLSRQTLAQHHECGIRCSERIRAVRQARRFAEDCGWVPTGAKYRVPLAVEDIDATALTLAMSAGTRH